MRGIMRAVRELARRGLWGRFLGDFGPEGNNVKTRRFFANNADFAATTGLRVPFRGASVHMDPQTFAGVRAEVYFGVDNPTSDDQWRPINPGSTLSTTDGGDFESFLVRRRTGSATGAAEEVVLVVDPAPYGSEAVEPRPRAPEVGSGGGAFARMRLIRRDSGLEVDVEGAPGSAATRGLVGIAGDTGAALIGLLATAAGRLAVNLIAGQEAITAAAGAVAANTPRMTLASDDPAVVSLAIMDDWDEADRAKTNPIVGQAGVAGNTGVVGATTQRVTLATDVALPTGANKIGKVDESTPYTVAAAVSADGAIVGATAGLRLGGFTAKETSGAATATFAIRHGTGVGDPIMARVALAAGQELGDVFPDPGLAAPNGIYFDLLTGAAEVIVYHRTVA